MKNNLTNNHKSWSTIKGAFLILAILTPAIIYIFNFHDHEISSQTSDWASLGSYLSGVYTPIVAALSIYIVYWSTRKQLNELKDQNKIDETIKSFNDTFDLFWSIAFKPIPTKLLFQNSEFVKAFKKKHGLEGQLTYSDQDQLLEIYSEKNDKQKIPMMKDIELIEALHLFTHSMGFELAVKELNSRNSLLENHLHLKSKSLAAQFAHLIMLSDRLQRLGLDGIALKAQFTRLFEIVNLLFNLQYLDEIVVGVAAQYWSQPDHTARFFVPPNNIEEHLIDKLQQEADINVEQYKLDMSFNIEDFCWTYTLTIKDKKYIYNPKNSSFLELDEPS